LIKEFREFVLRGNVVDLAVGVVMGIAFAAVIGALVGGVLTPLIAALLGGSSFAEFTLGVGDAELLLGSVLDELITFLLTAAAVFFFVVKPVNALMNRRKTGTEVEATTKECRECLSSIPAGARRCAFCTATQ
jgi:large conductance mechanosensitive channel